MLDESNLNSESLERLEGLFTTNLSESNESYYRFLYSLSWLYFQGREFAKAIELLRRARIAFEKSIKTSDVIDKDKAFKIDDITCWNASTILLKGQNFSLGWKLFDSGLRAPALGAQAWQRALPKPFTHDEVNVWRGESLTNKSILLLEEQGIGDVMQFMPLLPDFLHECSDISILVNDRLYPIYFRHYSKSKYSKQLRF